jgi:hypothetical protein
MHANLVTLGYDGSYGRVSAFVRAWKADRQREQGTSGRGTFVPLVFAPGEAFQFDWSEDGALLGGDLPCASGADPLQRACLLRQPAGQPPGLPAADRRCRRGADPVRACPVIQRSHHQIGRTVYDWRHYLAVIQRKPGALRGRGALCARCPMASGASRAIC